MSLADTDYTNFSKLSSPSITWTSIYKSRKAPAWPAKQAAGTTALGDLSLYYSPGLNSFRETVSNKASLLPPETSVESMAGPHLRNVPPASPCPFAHIDCKSEPPREFLDAEEYLNRGKDFTNDVPELKLPSEQKVSDERTEQWVHADKNRNKSIDSPSRSPSRSTPSSPQHSLRPFLIPEAFRPSLCPSIVSGASDLFTECQSLPDTSPFVLAEEYLERKEDLSKVIFQHKVNTHRTEANGRTAESVVTHDFVVDKADTAISCLIDVCVSRGNVIGHRYHQKATMLGLQDLADALEVDDTS